MRIGVLGAGGFIGSNLVEYLLERGEHEIIALDRDDEKLAGIGGPALRFVKGDILLRPELVRTVVRESDVVVDLIAYANPSIYVTNPLEVFRTNFVANMNVLDACIAHEKRLIQYSTAEVYGKPSGSDERYMEDESELLYGPVNKPRWIYACGKQLLERVIHAHGQRGDLEYTIVRPFNFIGPRLDYLVPAGTMGGPRVFAHYMSALLSKGPMYLVDGGEAHRSFTHIGDANRAFQAVLDHPDARNEIFNVGNPRNDISIRGVANLMMDLFAELTGEQPSSEVVVVDGETFYGAGYDDNTRIPPDVSKLTALGWVPEHDLWTTFRDAMSYYLTHEDVAPRQDEMVGQVRLGVTAPRWSVTDRRDALPR